jgi:hypothetical protein
MMKMFLRTRAPWLLALAVLAVGCGGTGLRGGKPVWVEKGAPKKADSGMLYAMGQAAPDMNQRMQMRIANNAATVELGRTIDTYVANLVKDFMQSHKDYADPSAAGSIQFVQSVSKSVTEATVRNAQQLDSYRDPETGVLYVLYEMPKASINQHLQDIAARIARTQDPAPFGDKTDEALSALKDELKKRPE